MNYFPKKFHEKILRNVEVIKKNVNSLCFFDHPLNFLKSYSSNRTQRLSTVTLLSGIKFTECGVPQGYILGPLLFIIYIMIFQITSKQ